MTQEVNWALLIATLALAVSFLNLVFQRRDKSAEKFDAFAKKFESSINDQKKQHTDELFSQAAALNRVEENAHRRIDDVIKLQNGNEQANLRRLSGIESKLSAVETHLKHTPDRHDLERVTNMLSTLGTTVARVEGVLKSNTDTTNRINQFLMEKGV